MSKGPILAIDYGSKYIGLAISDPDCVISLPFKAIYGNECAYFLDEIKKICDEKEIKKIVIGIPLNEDMTEGRMAETVKDFAKDLTEKVDIPIVFIDEHLSTFQARELLKDKKEITKEDQDIIAAQILLQNYIEQSFRTK